MLLKSAAIVLHTQKIKENATLVHLYTLEAGRVSLLLYGAQSKRKGKSNSFLYPLSVVSVESDLRNSRDLNTIKEIKQEEPNLELLFNPIKSSLAFFLAEVLLHALRTNEQDPLLFSFLRSSITYLNQAEKGLGNFHIAFLIRLSLFLGFQPTMDEDYSLPYFDLEEMEFKSSKPYHHNYLHGNEIQLMKNLLRMNYRNLHLFRFTRKERETLLNRILDYYHIHINGLGEIKSLYVLKEMFD